MKAEKYVRNKAAQAYHLSQMLEENMDDYLAKVAEGYPQDVKAMAKCALGNKLRECRGSCFVLPPIEEV